MITISGAHRISVAVGRGVEVGRVGVTVGVGVGEMVMVGVGLMGVKVGRRVGVEVGVGDWYQRRVAVGVRVSGATGEGVSRTSGGYNSSMAVCQSRLPFRTNSLKRAAG